MNLSTSDSNLPYKKRIIFLFLLILIFYIFANILGHKYDQYIRKISDDAYIYRGDIQGKFSFVKSMFGSMQPDIIFIGNSITGLHISTSFLYKHGIKSFNYANAGYFIGQYPLMIKNAIKLKPKVIALSILLEDFYMPSSYYYNHYDHDTDVSLTALTFIAKHTIEHNNFMLPNFILSYIKNRNYFIEKGYAIRLDIAEKYKHYTSGYRFLRAFFPKPHKLNRFPTRFTFDCDFDDQGNRYPKNCFNGDFVMIGHTIKLVDYRKPKYLLDKDYNTTLVSIFNDFFTEIKQAGIQPILILVPSYNEFIADKSRLSQDIRAPIIDLSNIEFSKEYFTDGVHFNIKGRKVYSEVLVNKMKPLLA